MRGRTANLSSSSTAEAVSSPIRWAGSKKKLLPVLAQYWRDTDAKYIEAFAGSARLFFEIGPQKAVLNDTNAELISAFKILAKKPVEIHQRVSQIPTTEPTYYKVRDERPSAALDRAVRFFYLNRNCFNGIYRTNREGRFNVPYGYKTGRLPPVESWVSAASSLKNARMYSLDFEEVVRKHVAQGDFVYLDPPYAVSNRRVFKQYAATEFGLEDLERLRSVMEHIDSVGATFVVSYAQSKETKQLQHGWHSFRKLALRNVAGFAHRRRKAVEVIITNDESRVPRC